MSVLDTIVTSNAALAANNIRIASLSVAAYDYLLTLPAEYRFYRTFYRSNFRFNTSLVLFVLIRYTSMIAGILGGWAFLSHNFTAESCQRFFLLPTLFRAFQCTISHAILGLRTYTISCKNSNVGVVLLSGYIIAIAVEWFASVYHRIPVSIGGACGATTLQPTEFFSSWLFYLAAMLYDLLTLSISMAYLFKYNSSSPFTSRLVKMMIYDGLGCFVALTAVNSINAVLFRSHNNFIQVAAAPCGGVVTWIMSQIILINLQDAGAERVRAETPSHIHRSTHSLNAKDRSSSGDNNVDQGGTELVQVRVDRSVVVGMGPLVCKGPCDWKAAAPCDHDEHFRTPAVKWDQGLV